MERALISADLVLNLAVVCSGMNFDDRVKVL